MTAVPVTNSGGVAISGLTPGVQYSIWTQAGPWYPTGNSSLPGSYGFALSPDGASWSALIGTSMDPWANYIGSPLSDTYKPTWCNGRENLDSVHVLLSFIATGSSVWIRAGDNPLEFGDNTGALDAELGVGTLPFCQYGTSPQGSVTGGIIITTAVIDAICIAAGVTGWIIPIFDGFIGKVLYGGDLCSGLPPVMPQFTNDDFLGGTGIPNPASLGKYWQALQAVAWPYFCQCNPGPIGSPPPIAVPPISALPPPAAPAGPIAVDCDNADVCTLLNQLMRQVSGMSNSIAQLRSDVTLIQRQKVPFGYVPGTVHSGLTGAGDFAVSDILGLSVNATTVPGRFVPAPGDPATYYRLGWVNTGTVDGWQVAREIRHNPELIFDLDGSVTRVGYDLADDVVATISELLREP